MIRIPVTILTGFLGAGKTTLLNRLLKENAGRKFAVVVNEFGDAGIDGGLLNGAEGGMVEINGGAVCCAAMGDTVQAMTALMSSDKNFERVATMEIDTNSSFIFEVNPSKNKFMCSSDKECIFVMDLYTPKKTKKLSKFEEYLFIK
mgnify:CR=1 FL=1